MSLEEYATQASIDLSDQPIGGADGGGSRIKELCAVLSSRPVDAPPLTSLCLRHARLSDADVDVLAQCLVDVCLSPLDTIDLSCNALTAASVRSLLPLLESAQRPAPPPAVLEEEAADTSPAAATGGKGGGAAAASEQEVKEEAKAGEVGEGSKHWKQGVGVQTLLLDDNHLEDEGAKELGISLAFNSMTHTLSVGQNGISDRGIEDLCIGVVTNSSLSKLTLDSNLFGDSGAKALANMLAGLGLEIETTPLLRPAVFEEMKEAEEEEERAASGAAANAKAKKGKDKKKDDKKAGKKLSEEEAAKEAAIRKINKELYQKMKQRRRVALLRNGSLKEISVASNAIAFAGLDALAHACRSHTSLLSLGCSGNKQTVVAAMDRVKNQKAEAEVARAVQRNWNLRLQEIQTALFMGLHPRVGARSSVQKVKTAGTLSPVWDFLGRVDWDIGPGPSTVENFY